MKIELADRGRSHRLRRSTQKRGAMRQFQTAIARPQLPAQRRARRAAAERQSRAIPGPERTRPTRTRPARSRRAAGPAEAAATLARWPRVMLKLAALVAVAGLVALLVHAFTSPRFFVYSATVAGSQHLSAEAIYQAAAIHEKSIFWVRPGEVQDRIGQLQGIKAVHVTVGLPAQVRIAVEEREPVVMWRVTAQQHDWWLDEEGVVLPYHGDVNNTIFVVDSTPRELHEGDRLQPDDLVWSVRQLAAALPGEATRVFYYEPDRGLSFVHSEENGDKWPVFVGTGEDLPRKIAIVRALSDYLLEHNIRPRYIDVRWADHPVYGAPDGQAVQPNG